VKTRATMRNAFNKGRRYRQQVTHSESDGPARLSERFD
jgi:hypothetical protein